MDNVRDTYILLNESVETANKAAVEWGDKIIKNPDRVDVIVEKEWPEQLKKMRKKYILQTTTEQLMRAYVPKNVASDYANRYYDELLLIEKNKGIIPWIPGQKNKTLQESKQNLQNLANEYYKRTKGNDLKNQLTLSDLHGPQEVYKYAKDMALRGNWFPFAAYLASKKGKYIDLNSIPTFFQDPKLFKLALKGDRTSTKILWTNIVRFAGGIALAVVLFKGFRKLYSEYESKKSQNIVTVRVINDDSSRNQLVWKEIGKILKLSKLDNLFREKTYIDKKGIKYNERNIRMRYRPSKTDIDNIKKKIIAGLKTSDINLKVGVKTTSSSKSKNEKNNDSNIFVYVD